jgi:tRNA pseudouridine32 synthase / 23S rRNA pseudouridine746 synthase
MPVNHPTDNALIDDCFNAFKAPISAYSLPERFTFPFYYQPHPLCLQAASELQAHLSTQTDWIHNFGLSGEDEGAIGKMFGVLLVQNKNNEIGYLAAFSGKLAESNHLGKFVPPVFDVLDKAGFYLQGQTQLNQLTAHIKTLENSPQFLTLADNLNKVKKTAGAEIEKQCQLMIEKKKQRKIKRTAAETELKSEDFEQLKQSLGKQSVDEKNWLKDLKTYWQQKIEQVAQQYTQLNTEILALKDQRKSQSSELQLKIFNQYQFLNSHKQSKSLFDIFASTPQKTPPAAAGECAAPKLLQYAFSHQMKPLAMAEFWWGTSPKSEIRKHQHFYPACQGKCRPILSHMLDGIKMDDNPFLHNPGASKSFDIIYEDEAMLVINKPAGLLSVPGKNIEDSVYQRIKISYPNATGPLIVHRLDMATSGLLLIALTKDSHKNLQKQFTKRTVKKRYCALLDGILTEDEGIIDLPLRVDLDDRPRQLVCYEYGKAAKTRWQVIERKDEKTKVYFYPITGRTHQLRVHAAHSMGLNTPIIGDALYGDNADRLYLHAETIEFSHPISKERMSFKVDAEF